MDQRYEAYCLADPLFYDHPASHEDPASVFDSVRRPAPAGWTSSSAGDWRHLTPDDHRPPDQGWKIHVSATPDSAGRVLDVLWEHCYAARLPFAFLRSPGLVFLRNSRYAEPGTAGRFATLHPADEAELEHTLKQLDDLLSGSPGPCVPSALRYGTGPLYVAPPPGAELPDFLAAHAEANQPQALAGLEATPYRIERALRVTNGGGVYQGTDTRTGRRVLLKQAREHAGLTGDGRDAVARLESERDVLRLAAGSGAAPGVLDWIELGEQRFLVLEFVEGRILNTLLGERFPLIGREPDPRAVRAYTAWALGIQVKVERAIAALHERGVVFNDLHLFNIMVRPDGSVTLIDFAAATPIALAGRREVIAARGFQAPRGVTGPAVDEYALACLRLSLFLPLTGLLALDRGRARALADAVRGEFPGVPSAFLDEAARRITTAGQAAGRIPALCPNRELDAPIVRGDWPALRASLAESIGASATPERTDRLFPGDIRQFAYPGAGLGFAYGAAGVLYALHAAGVAVSDEYEHWLLRRVDALPADARLGFYDGVHGIAYVLDALGHRSTARRLLDRALDEGWQRLGPDLTEGLAGVGLNLLHFSARTADAELHGAALEAGRLAVEVLAQQDAARARKGEWVSGPAGRAGLMRGASGAALLFLHLYERTNDEDWLARARAALRMDLACCVVAERDGSMRVNEGRRAVPYLADGGAGIALVLRRYLAHEQDETFRAVLAAIGRASTSRFYAQAGLFNGRAGLVYALADADAYPAVSPAQGAGDTAPDGNREDPAVDQMRRLAWHAAGYRGALAFPGDQTHRLSTDLATGGAGVLLAFGAVLGEPGARLPFLGPPPKKYEQ